MKKNPCFLNGILLFVMAGLFAACGWKGGGLKRSTPEEVVEYALKSLEAKSFGQFEKVLPSDAHIPFLVEKTDRPGITEEKMKQDFEKYKERISVRFDDLLEEIERIGFHWKNAERISLKKEDLGQKDGLQQVTVFVKYESYSRIFQFEFKQIAELDDGWYLSGPPMINEVDSPNPKENP